MPFRSRKPNELAQEVLPLMLLGIGLVASNRYFVVLDDEVRTLESAQRQAREILGACWSGVSLHGYSPLYDLVLHFWLRLTSYSAEGLRILPVIFFLLGMLMLARSARRMGGSSSAWSVVWLGVLWPLGFHYGRLNAGYAWTFCLVAWLTLAYLRCLEEQSAQRWITLFAAGTLLIWTHHFGVAILLCLGIDQWMRRRRGESIFSTVPLISLAGLWCATLVPLLPALRHDVAATMAGQHNTSARVAAFVLSIYTLFVSESVAPWYWTLGVPAAIAVLACLYLVFSRAPRPARRLLFYVLMLCAVLALAGQPSSRQLMIVAPWLLLSVSILLGTGEPDWSRCALVGGLVVVGAIGWYGAYARTFYAEPSFLEPWPTVADSAAGKILQGATVISDKPAFFYYLSYAVRDPALGSSWEITGLLPDQLHHPQVTSIAGWMAAGHSLARTMIWVRGMPGPDESGPMMDAARELDRTCGGRSSRLTRRDRGYRWKQKFFPGSDALQWRVEVREYDCPPAGSLDTLSIPIQ